MGKAKRRKKIDQNYGKKYNGFGQDSSNQWKIVELNIKENQLSPELKQIFLNLKKNSLTSNWRICSLAKGNLTIQAFYRPHHRGNNKLYCDIAIPSSFGVKLSQSETGDLSRQLSRKILAEADVLIFRK